MSGFNRDIVECKVDKQLFKRLCGRGFNRDIVECKEDKIDAVVKEILSVLIET